MDKKDLYVVVVWPESQDYIDRPDCHLINDEGGLDAYGSSAYFVPLSIYEGG